MVLIYIQYIYHIFILDSFGWVNHHECTTGGYLYQKNMASLCKNYAKAHTLKGSQRIFFTMISGVLNKLASRTMLKGTVCDSGCS